AFPEGGTAHSPPTGPVGRDLRRGSGADARACTELASGDDLRGADAAASGTVAEDPPDAGTTGADLASPARRREGGDFSPSARAGSARAIGLHRHERSGCHRRRSEARSPALSLPVGLLGVRACPCGP